MNQGFYSLIAACLLVAAGALLLAFCVGCGGAEFTVSVFPDAGAGAVITEPLGPALDAGAGDAPDFVDANTPSISVPDGPASTGPQSPNDGSVSFKPDSSDDAGASMRDAGTSSPPADAATPPDASSWLCQPDRCPACAVGLPCCAAGGCGCEISSQGGQCL